MSGPKELPTPAIAGPVHFVGIGGVGQRATAEVLLAQGVPVTGSDLQDSEALSALARLGAAVHVGHSASNVGNAKIVVVSSAIPEQNPEIAEARRRDAEVIKNAELLRRLGSGRRTLAVAGTHGKTTTTSMLAWVLISAGLDPAAVAGGEMRNLASSGHAGAGPWFVVEADEYDRRFLRLEPWCAVVNNLEPDHLDYYGSLEALVGAFRQFVASVPPDGLVVLGADDEGAGALAPYAAAPTVRFGLGPADWQAIHVRQTSAITRFAILHDGRIAAECALQVPGLHNVRNALAACAAAAAAGVGADVAAAALGEFQGARRRFDLAGEAGGVTVLDDYAHLPAKLRAAIGAARQRYPGRRLWAVFQPHTYARTRLLIDDFVAACAEADRTVIVSTYAPSGREQVNADQEARDLAARLDAPYLPGKDAVPEALASQLAPGDVVLLLGAGDIYLAAQPLLQLLRAPT